ncbi:hypothetical protein BH11PSE2_BH11PSE2_22280 [soil metagenome]
MIRPALAAVLVLCAAAASAQTPEQRRVFVGCPILRNTSPVPCWLGEDAGELYYLGPQGDLGAAFYPPQFNHKMLVEGVVTSERKCGAIVLKNVKTSVLPDLEPTCNITLPAQGYSESTEIRGPGPSGKRGEPAETRPRPPPPSAPALTPPYAARDFTATFDADTERMWRQAQSAVTEAARYITATKAQAVTVTGYRAAIRLSNGSDFVERDSVGPARAKTVADALRNIGLPAGTKLTVKSEPAPIPSTGAAKDADSRKVVISVSP